MKYIICLLLLLCSCAPRYSIINSSASIDNYNNEIRSSMSNVNIDNELIEYDDLPPLEN